MIIWHIHFMSERGLEKITYNIQAELRSAARKGEAKGMKVLIDHLIAAGYDPTEIRAFRLQRLQILIENRNESRTLKWPEVQVQKTQVSAEINNSKASPSDVLVLGLGVNFFLEDTLNQTERLEMSNEELVDQIFENISQKRLESYVRCAEYFKKKSNENFAEEFFIHPDIEYSKQKLDEVKANA
jgi:hypothetical protein